jgi:hypothetical protein
MNFKGHQKSGKFVRANSRGESQNCGLWLANGQKVLMCSQPHLRRKSWENIGNIIVVKWMTNPILRPQIY